MNRRCRREAVTEQSEVPSGRTTVFGKSLCGIAPRPPRAIDSVDVSMRLPAEPLPHDPFLLHQPSTMAYGSASDIQINGEEIVKLRERYNQIVGEECGKSMEQVTKDADRDFWLSPEEARKYGLVGRVVKNIGDLG